MVYDDVCYYTVYIQNCICVKIQTRCLFKPFEHRKAIVNFLWTQKYVPSTENHVKTWHSIINPEVSHPNPLPSPPPNALIWRIRATPSRVSNSYRCAPLASIGRYNLCLTDLILPPLRWVKSILVPTKYCEMTRNQLCLPGGFSSTLKYTKEIIKPAPLDSLDRVIRS